MFKKKKKDKRWKALKQLETMSDEEVLELEKKLYVKSGIATIIGFVLFTGCLLLLYCSIALM